MMIRGRVVLVVGAKAVVLCRATLTVRLQQHVMLISVKTTKANDGTSTTQTAICTVSVTPTYALTSSPVFIMVSMSGVHCKAK